MQVHTHTNRNIILSGCVCSVLRQRFDVLVDGAAEIYVVQLSTGIVAHTPATRFLHSSQRSANCWQIVVLAKGSGYRKIESNEQKRVKVVHSMAKNVSEW